MISPVVFIKEVRTELKRVDWPNKQQVTRLTVVVVSVSVVVALFVGGLDLFFAKLMEFGLNL